jgi:hypothetical protein
VEGTTSIDDGTVSAPALTFTDDLDTGFYRIGANRIGISTGNKKVVDITKNDGITFFNDNGETFNVKDDTGTTTYFTVDGENDEVTVGSTCILSTPAIRAGNGLVTGPGYGFTGEPNTGLYKIGTSNVGLSLGGVKHVDFSTTRTEFTGNIDLSTTNIITINETASGDKNVNMAELVGINQTALQRINCPVIHAYNTGSLTDMWTPGPVIGLLTNRAVTVPQLLATVPLQPRRGGLTLYLKNIYFNLTDADPDNYASRVRLITNATTITDDTTGWNTTGEHTVSRAASSVASTVYAIYIALAFVADTIEAIDFSYVNIEYYYA